MSNAQQVYDTHFRDCPRSKEWLAGARYMLRRELDGIAKQPRPFANGTAQDDAWRAGAESGLAMARQIKRGG